MKHARWRLAGGRGGLTAKVHAVEERGGVLLRNFRSVRALCGNGPGLISEWYGDKVEFTGDPVTCKTCIRILAKEAK